MTSSTAPLTKAGGSLLTAETLDRVSYQLSLLYRAGMPSEESLHLMAEDMSAQQMGAIFAAMAEGLGRGMTLSEAAEETGVFPGHFLHMLKIGEASGNTDEVLLGLSAYYKRSAATQSALRRAFTYPAMMAGLIVAVFAVMLSQVLPVFSKVFQQMGVDLPPVAKALLAFGDGSAVVAIGLCVVLLAATLWFLLRVRSGKGLPIGKKASLALERGQFSSAMSMLLSSGISLEEGLEYAENLFQNSPMAAKLQTAQRKMADGVSFAKALEETAVLTPLQSGLLAAAVRTGETERAMDEVAERCMEESQLALHYFVSKLEFLLVVALCASVGLVLLSVMLPLVGILSAIG